MKKRLPIYIATVILLVAALQSCSRDYDEASNLDTELRSNLESSSPSNSIDYFKLPTSNDFDNIPQDPNNPINSAKVELGKLLFHETGLGTANKIEDCTEEYSCASCHHALAGFQAGIVQGIGEGGHGFGSTGEARMMNPLFEEDMIDVQPIRTPTTLNGAYQRNMLWNGQFGATAANIGTEANWTPDTPKEFNNLGFEGLEIQAIAGMGVHRLEIGDKIKANEVYRYLFEMAFGMTAEESMTRENAGLAIAAYERTLLANQSPFQDWLRGDIYAMTDNQKEGALLFFGKAECSSCHTGPALNSEAFYALGMPDLEGGLGTAPDAATQKGRGGFTGVEADNYKFKVPQLYSISHSPFYGHGGNFNTVREVIEYKNAGIPMNTTVPSSQISSLFRPLNLTEAEITQLTDFVQNALNDNNLTRYEPSTLPTDNCFPNNDINSRIDKGCE